MAITYTDVFKLTNDTAFQQRLQVAIWRAATIVRREDVATPSHAQRDVWAKSQLTGPTNNLREVTIRVATFGQVLALGSAVTDNDLQTAVNQIVNDLAGA